MVLLDKLEHLSLAMIVICCDQFDPISKGETDSGDTVASLYFPFTRQSQVRSDQSTSTL